MASSNTNTMGLIFVGVLALVIGKTIVQAPPPSPSNPTRPPMPPGPMLPPPGKPGQPGPLPGAPLKPLPPGLEPGPDRVDPAPGKPAMPVLPDQMGYNDPFTTATWSTSDNPATGGNPGSMVVIDYEDPFDIRKPRYGDKLLSETVIVNVAEQAPGDPEGNEPAEPGAPIGPEAPGAGGELIGPGAELAGPGAEIVGGGALQP